MHQKCPKCGGTFLGESARLCPYCDEAARASISRIINYGNNGEPIPPTIIEKLKEMVNEKA